MNFLAHLYLAEPGGVASGPAMVGNLLPDFVRGRQRTEVPLDPAVAAGAARHRRVDRFTDSHAVFLRSRGRLWDTAGRYAGILTDVFYDHILSRDWSRYHDLPLADFIQTAHQRLAAAQNVTPEPMRPIAERMIEQDWLSTYASHDGLELTLARMSKRFTERFGREVRLQDTLTDLPTLRPALTDDFHEFFPALIAYVENETPNH